MLSQETESCALGNYEHLLRADVQHSLYSVVCSDRAIILRWRNSELQCVQGVGGVKITLSNLSGKIRC